MRILVADQTGLVKQVKVEEQKVLTSFGKQETGMPIKGLVRVGTDYFATSHEDRHIRIYSLNDNTYSYEVAMKSKAEIMSLAYNENKVYVLQKDGVISELEVLYQEDMPYLEEPQELLKINATQCNRIKINPYNTSRMAVLSKDTNPQIIDLNEKTVVWKARNVKNDYLDLAVPIFDTDCAFKTEHEFYVCTAYHKIRLYDTRTKNCKPVTDFECTHTKQPLNNIVLNQGNDTIFVSDHEGGIYNLDPKKNFGTIGKLKGANGACKEMAVSDSSPYLASVGLDRYLRVYNINTNTLYQKIFMKQKLQSVVIIDEEVEEKDEDEDAEKEAVFKPHEHQNEVKKKAKELRAKAKKARIRLTFEKNKKVKTDEPEQQEYNGEYNEEYEENDYNDNDYNEDQEEY